MSTNPPSSEAPSPEEWHLARAVEHEVEELIHHPRQEMHRLRDEAERGESGTTLAIILTAIAIFVTLAVTAVLVVVWLSAGGL
jgi:hypothetical protein